ncbi:polysaccharide biosynthesis/export family protein [Patiriisocius hiemis]|uniref:Polysaccharide biosynthesis/export family protein n=1 Tax=Patiriisocius hiemis TaxID=3075604 RepID=A0ABU2YFU1_9FLAO|nr:polysaccharide biosynthesis/export family protein [Constantimarinum sp. W242]MDT0556650.1 polysaccharide biosynthesis/export family protein [Constantimarinum sp. W242]
MKIIKIVSIIFLALVSSCVPRKDIAYFQNIESLAATQNKEVTSITIQPSDLLSIVVSARNIEAARPFNLLVETRPTSNDLAALNLNNFQQQPYLVSEAGTIIFPELGEIEVKDLSITQLNAKLTNLLKTYLKEPVVSIRLLNFQVSVLGEVTRPGTFPVVNERLSLPAALGLAGDLTIYGQRDNILVLREKDGKKVYKYVDITDASFINSDYYYLQQNDIVYVEPNNAQRQSSSFNRNSSIYVGIASLLVSVLVLIFR